MTPHDLVGPDGESPERIRARTISLVEYLLAVRSQIEKPARTVPTSDAFWHSELPVHPDCRVGPGTEDAAWLQVGMPAVPSPVEVPDQLEPFMLGPPRADVEPELQQSLIGEHDDLDTLRTQFEWWQDNDWRPWASETITIEQTRQLNSALFELRHRLDMRVATDELVWGHGVMELPVGEHRVRYPLLVSPVAIDYDPENSVVTVAPQGPPRLQIDPLTSLNEQRLADIVEMTGPGGQIDVDVWDDVDRRQLFQRALRRMGFDPVVRESDASDPGVPHIHDTDVLFVRPRQRMLRRFLETFRERLLAGDIETIGALASILAHEPSNLQMPTDQPDAWRAIGERLLMPLPTNEAQESIARRLASHRSVAVQGPPGTGKTHTIRNLICHLMAYGKRVLVVAQKEDPLRVLRDGLPKEIQALCLAVLGRSSDQLTQLQMAARELSDRASTLDQPAAQTERDRLAVRLEQAERDLGRALAALRSIAESESARFTIDGVSLGAREVGEWLAAEASKYGDIPDPVPDTTPPPLTSEEFSELLRLATTLARGDRRKAARSLPVVADLPAADVVLGDRARLAEATTALRELSEQRVDLDVVRDVGARWLSDLRAEVKGAAGRLAERERGWIGRLGRLEAHWKQAWQEHRTRSQELLDDLMAIHRAVGVHEVAIREQRKSERWQLLEQLRELRQRLGEGKTPRRLFQPALHRLAEGCRVDGHPIRTTQDTEIVIAFLRRNELRRELGASWAEWMRRLDGPPPDSQAEPEMWAGPLMAQADQAATWEADGWPSLHLQIARLIPGVAEALDSAALREVAIVLERCEEIFVHDRLAAADRSVAAYLEQGASGTGASDLWREIELAWNDPRLTRWADLLTEVRRLAALQPAVQRYQELSSRLKSAAPDWAAEIDSGTAAALGCTGTDCMRRWHWRQAQTWLDTAVTSVDPAGLHRSVERAREQIRQLTRQLVVASSWLEVSLAMDDRRRAALADWATALRKIGKGTGKNAARWQAYAQSAMAQAVDAVPVWVMTVDRAIEQFAADGANFDLVIVDEASQADMFGLPVLSLATRAVVVGDDQQIGPQLPFVGGIAGLINAHLADVPSAEHFDNESSLYDHAVRRSPQRILLTEHFRCVPAIIEFSSRAYYDGAIEPLRSDVPVGIGDPVNAVHIREGIRQTLPKFGDVNVAEAEALVERLATIVADPVYRGKTIGVISLLSGSGQALYLLDRIQEIVGADEMARRNLRVGDPYTFQGDERDVVLISTVVSPHNGPVSAFTRREFHRRVNVAASRAKDQMWVFHSVEGSDLRADDARAMLLEYCANVSVAEQAYEDLEGRCESDFERAVLRHLLLRGYRPQPQFRIGGNRIDFVLPAADGRRLAIECDGDPYHGLDRWEADLRRQAILERVGNCVFVRIRGSVFARDPEVALGPLWQRVEELQIKPAVGDSQAGGSGRLPSPTGDGVTKSPAHTRTTRLNDTELMLDRGEPLSERNASGPRPEVAVEDAAVAARALAASTASVPRQVIQKEAVESRPVQAADGRFLEVPAGYRGVAWLRPVEAECALQAQTNRGDVPIWKDGKVAGWARYHGPESDLATKFRSNIAVERVGAAGPRIVCWVREYEAKAVVEAARRGENLEISDASGRHCGLVQYFPPDSEAARRYRSVTRLLRARRNTMP